MDAQKQQAIDRLKSATNILVTVSKDPSVDQLSAAIGITLLLNKLGKHATAVYSGKTPSTIEFLQPEKTIEKNTDSLRDFIIALDKSKADKLRYKVEDQMVKIFITPYRTSISDKDLEFSQGDFNVEVVLALGVARQQDLDQAITSHGRILHDATVIGIATHAEEEALGSINWVDAAASSLSEMMTHLGLAIDAEVLDAQMSTALLTGIVAETERFSNQKTTAETMQASAKLMEAGANQQLVASELATPAVLGAELSDQAGPDGEVPGEKPAATAQADGSLVIEHEPGETSPEHSIIDDLELPEPEEEPKLGEIHIDYDGQIKTEDNPDNAPASEAHTLQGSPHLVLQPPTLGGKLTANSEPEGLDPSVDPLAATNPTPLLHHSETPDVSESADVKDQDTVPAEEPKPSEEVSASPSVPEPPTEKSEQSAPAPSDMDTGSISDQDTLSDLEKFVASPHIASPSSSVQTEPTSAGQSDQDQSASSNVSPAAPEPTTAESPAQTETSVPAETPAPKEAPTQDQSTSPAPTDDAMPFTNVNAARDAVDQAMVSTTPASFEPVQSLNAMPVDLNLGDIPAVNTSPASAFASTNTYVPPGSDQDNQGAQDGASGLQEQSTNPETPMNSPQDAHVSSDPGLPPGLITNEPIDMTAAPNANATSSPTVPAPQGPAPEVPPPMMPPNFGPSANQSDQQPAVPSAS